MFLRGRALKRISKSAVLYIKSVGCQRLSPQAGGVGPVLCSKGGEATRAEGRAERFSKNRHVWLLLKNLYHDVVAFFAVHDMIADIASP